MHKELGKIPKTMKEIYRSAFDSDVLLAQPLGRILNKPFRSIKEIYDFLEERDALTDAIYGCSDPEGKYVFPFAVPEDKVNGGVGEVIAKLGSQYPGHHMETIQEHTCLVVNNLVELGMAESDAVLIGVLHDCGKKYVTATNAQGHLCFYNHEIVSAFLAGHWMLSNFYVDGDKLRLIIAVVFNHMELLSWKRQDHGIDDAREKLKNNLAGFFDCPVFAERAMDYINLITEADKSCKTEEEYEDAKAKIAIGKKLIASATSFSDY